MKQIELSKTPTEESANPTVSFLEFCKWFIALGGEIKVHETDKIAEKFK